MKNLIKQIFPAIAILILGICAGEVQMTKAIWKKIDKAIAKAWEVEESTKSPFDLSSVSLAELKFSGAEKLFQVSSGGEDLLGFMVVSQAPSRYDNFDLMVLYDLKMNIVRTEILAYREDWGGEITSARWLKQFVGKSANDRIELSYGIQGISGATISCKSAVEEINRLTQLMAELHQSGQLFTNN